MPEEKNLSLVNTVEDTDKIRVVTSAEGLSQSIEVGHLRNSLFINELSGKVDTLENKANINDTDHTNINSKIEELELVLGEGGDEGSGLIKEISLVRSDLTTLSTLPVEVNRLDGELDGIRADLTSINGKDGKLDILTDRQTNLESAINASFKIIDELPVSASAIGQPGEVYLSSEYFYVCVGTNTWKRIPLQDW